MWPRFGLARKKKGSLDKKKKNCQIETSSSLETGNLSAGSRTSRAAAKTSRGRAGAAKGKRNTVTESSSSSTHRTVGEKRASSTEAVWSARLIDTKANEINYDLTQKQSGAVLFFYSF